MPHQEEALRKTQDTLDCVIQLAWERQGGVWGEGSLGVTDAWIYLDILLNNLTILLRCFVFPYMYEYKGHE